MKILIEKQLGNVIGINIARAHRIDAARLVAAEDDYFSVETDENQNRYHIPYANIVKIVENPDGVSVSGLFVSHKSYPFVIKVGHVVEYAPT